jgi:ribonuclease BN (tRNA processing enzyme)
VSDIQEVRFVLTLTFLGVGAAFAKKNFNSNALIEAWSSGPDGQDAPDDTLLVDFGTTGPLALHHLRQKPGFSYLDDHGRINYPAIKRIFVSHLHSDHIGGLEELAAMNIHIFSDPKRGACVKPTLYGSPEVLLALWDHSLRGGLGVLAGREARLEDYFNVVMMQSAGQAMPDRFRMRDRYEFSIVPTDHVRVSEKRDWPSFGLVIRDRQSSDTVFYSGDTRFDPKGLGEIMESAKIIFHEVLLLDIEDAVHATLSELRTLPEPVRKKMTLFHYDDMWDDASYNHVDREFAGFAQPQQRYTLFP